MQGKEFALLARELLALHEVEQGHQQARDAGLGRAVRRLEDHGQQAGHQIDIEGRGRLRRQRAAGNALAQRGQGVQALQHMGDAAEQPRAMAGVAGESRTAGLHVHPLEAVARRSGHAVALGHLGQPGRAAARACAGQKHVGQAALLLQRMDEAAEQIHQGAGALQLLQLADFALPRGHKKVESGFHGGLGPVCLP